MKPARSGNFSWRQTIFLSLSHHLTKNIYQIYKFSNTAELEFYLNFFTF